jgi:hypothetical protein
MRHILIYIITILLSFPALAQNEIVMKYAATITQDDLKGLLTIIASDALEGREIGTRGQKMAAAFIVEEFKRIGLTPVVPTSEGMCYLQKFKLENYEVDDIYLKTDNMHFNLMDNLLFSGKRLMPAAESEEVVLLVGDEVPSRLNLDNKVHLIIATSSEIKEHAELVSKAYKNGASMVILIPFATDQEFKMYRKSDGRNYARTKYGFEQKVDGNTNAYFLVSPHVAASILQEESYSLANLLADNVSTSLISKINNKGLKITYFTSMPSENIETENVLGYLEGSDKKDELVIITAHYDHIGRNGEIINNGADDDGSGTSAVIEIAEAYAKAKAAGKGPRRSILFMTVTGEEKGLIGSQYYTCNPIFPLTNTVVDLNMDMIGRHDKVHDDDREFVYLVGSDRLSSELHELSEKANSTFTNLSLDYTYNDENHPMQIYYRSDHWNFAKHNVPIIFYFNGVHDDYHRPTDTVDKIEFDLLQKRAQLVFYTSWFIANRDQRLVVDKLQDTEINPNN